MATFKNCTCCGQPWPTRGEFLGDPALTLIGYQVSFAYLQKGMLLFNHEACGTSLAVEAGKFEDLYVGPFWAERKTGEEECTGYCLDRDNLAACPVLCECRWVREVIRVISERFPGLIQSTQRRAALR